MTARCSDLLMPYQFAAVRLAIEHAERRLQHSLDAFIQSLDAPEDRRFPIAESLSTRLALLRQGAISPTTAAPAAEMIDRDARRAA